MHTQHDSLPVTWPWVTLTTSVCVGISGKNGQNFFDANLSGNSSLTLLDNWKLDWCQQSYMGCVHACVCVIMGL